MPGYWFREEMHLPRPVSPLGATAILPGVREGQRRGFLRFGGPDEAGYRIVDGYAYIGVADPSRLAPPAPAQMAAAQQAFLDMPRAWEHDVLPELLRLYGESRALAPPGCSPRQAARDARRAAAIFARMYELHFEVCFPIMGAAYGFEVLLAQAGVPDPGRAVVGLCEGTLTKIGELDEALQQLGAVVEGDAALATIVESQDAEALVEALQADPGEAGQRFRALWPQLLERPQGAEVFEPTWGEDPAPLLRALAGGGAAWKQRQAAQAGQRARRDAVERDVRARLPEAMRAPFEGMLQAMRAAWPLMQTHHYWMDELGTGLARLALLRCAEPLVGAGLGSREEVVFLHLDELVGALEGKPLRQGLVEERRRERDAQLRLTPARELGTLPPELAHDPMMLRFFGLRPSEAGHGRALRGLAASPGKLRARARVVVGEAELGALEPGEVLVATTTEPAWTSVMARAGALVTDVGGVLCHAAIVAREYNLPAVVGAQGATVRIRTGELVEVDGDAGTVTLL